MHTRIVSQMACLPIMGLLLVAPGLSGCSSGPGAATRKDSAVQVTEDAGSTVGRDGRNEAADDGEDVPAGTGDSPGDVDAGGDGSLASGEDVPIETGGSTDAREARGPDRATPPLQNVLVLLTDDQRYNTIHALGNRLIRTPNMDRLAFAGTSYSQASDQGGLSSPVCLTSRVELMTGRTINHLDGPDVISPKYTTLPEFLRQAGYSTFATGKWHNDVASFVRIFDDGDNIFFGAASLAPEGGQEHIRLFHFDPTGAYPAAAQFQADKFSSTMFADAAIHFLQTRPTNTRPFFCYVAFTSPHDPRTPPPPFDTMYDPSQIPLPENFLAQHPFDNGELDDRDEELLPWPRDPDKVRREIAAYYGMISQVDFEIGRILDTLNQQGLLDHTIIVFAGDNGIALGAHGLLGKASLYEEAIRVPLIIAGSGVAANAVSEEYAYLSDVLPTVASLLGLAPPASCDGRALLGDAVVAPARQNAYHQFRNLQRAIRTADRWKLIGYNLSATGPQFDRLQLFDLVSDPSEMNDLSSTVEYQGKLSELKGLLSRERALYDDPLLQ